jgi:hypothetical protein
MAARIAMIAITTRSSIRVNAFLNIAKGENPSFIKEGLLTS